MRRGLTTNVPKENGNSSVLDRNQSGFTLVELLVVIAIIAILAALLLPALTGTRRRADSIVCQANLKQLQLGWHLYAMDNDSFLPPNPGWYYGPIGGTPTWVDGYIIYETDVGTMGGANNYIRTTVDPSVLMKQGPGRIGFRYLSPPVYHCPGDRSYAFVDDRKQSRVRSYSMNSHMGTGEFYQWVLDPARWEHDFLTLNQVEEFSPSSLFVFLDEHEDSIDDARFDLLSLAQPANGWFAVPASRHGRSGNLSFADGHTENHRWFDDGTIYPVRRKRLVLTALARRDSQWMRDHATVPVPR